MYEKQIDELQRKLTALPPLSKSSLERLMKDFLVSYTYNSNAIEGSTLTERETYLVLNDGLGISGKELRYQMDAVGHKNAYEFISEKASESAELNEGFIKEIHSRVLMAAPDAAGQYRDVPVHISGSDTVLTAPENVPQELRRLLEDYRSQMQSWHISRRIAVFHLRFENIHPFIDGNGRTGRLLLNFELLRNGFPPVDFKYNDRARYYDCFRAYEKGDELSMVYLVHDYMRQALQQRISQMEISANIRSQPTR